MTTTIEFLKAISANTEHGLYVCSFTNEREAGAERHVISRKGSEITAFLERWDKPERGAFVCVSTIKDGQQKRNKENASEIGVLHADIDFKGVDGLPADPDAALAEVQRQLGRLKHQPSITVFSGNGVHAYWLLNEPINANIEQDRIEALMRQLSDLVAGDLAVCEVARVMRMPGTHNTKNGAWTEVTIQSFHPDRRYDISDIEEWCAEQSPVMLRKERERGRTVAQADDDFFARYAREHGIKAPIDVEARLNAMSYMGGADSNIHQTQLECSASMLSSGIEIEDVVSILLDATRKAAGAYGANWNWKREERTIREMCTTWIKKHPPEQRKKRERAEPEQQSEPVKAKPELKIVGSNTKPAPKPIVIKKEDQHVAIGRCVLAKMDEDGEQIISTKDGVWYYANGIWDLRAEPKWLNARIVDACERLGFKNTTKMRNETRGWIEARPELWREQEIPWDQHGKIPTRAGLVDPRTGELEPAKPEHFATWRIDVEYDPAATCPWWMTMIADMFGDKGDDEQRELVRVMQELFGCALIDKKPRSLSKACVLWGIANLGKSGPLDVIAGLFGNSISAPIGSVEGTHGLMPFQRRAPWVLHEAFNGQWNFSTNVKSIITQDPVQINVKNGPMLNTVIRAPIFWATNFQPQFKEATRAIVDRMIVIEVSRQFDNRKPIGAAAEALRRGFSKPGELVVATELPGLLNWAIAGLRRALERGSIETTKAVEKTSDAIHKDSNLVAGFLDECIDFDPMARIRVSDFCLAHTAWWMELKGEDRRLPTNEAIGKAMKAVGDPRIGMDPDEMRDSTSRYYCGVALNRRGLSFHRTAYESRLFEGKIASATDPQREVNRLIPATWDARISVQRMRVHQHLRPNDRAVMTDDDDDAE
jgi:P4 family phage/plasmid primase-like protien